MLFFQQKQNTIFLTARKIEKNINFLPHIQNSGLGRMGNEQLSEKWTIRDVSRTKTDCMASS